MQRYGQDLENMTDIIKRDTGPYVLYSDAMAEIEDKGKEIAKLKEVK